MIILIWQCSLVTTVCYNNTIFEIITFCTKTSCNVLTDTYANTSVSLISQYIIIDANRATRFCAAPVYFSLC